MNGMDVTIHTQGVATAEQHLGSKYPSQNNACNTLHSSNLGPDQAQNMPNSHQNRELWGIAFDHGQLPKIAAVYSMHNSTKTSHENACTSQMMQSKEEQCGNRDAMQRVMPPISAHRLEMPYSVHTVPHYFAPYDHTQHGYSQAVSNRKQSSVDQNCPLIYGNPPPPYNTLMFSERPPTQHAAYYGISNENHKTSAVRFPYDRFPLGTQPVPLPQKYFQPSYHNTSLIQHSFPNAVSNTNYYNNYSAPVECSYSDLLNIENKHELLQLLKLEADQSRLRLSNIIKKLLEGNYLANSLCLLERVKFSNLTEQTKKKIISVVDEIIWKAPPQDDFWQKNECGPMDENANYDDDIEFEKQQQQYLEELISQSDYC